MKAREWPSGGEVDMFETVNLQKNAVALHSTIGCYAGNSTATSEASGTMSFNDCNYQVAANHGCTFESPTNASYGPSFAAVGGGVYATELASDGISVWFFSVSFFLPFLALATPH
jgi:hypothetical protein